MGGDVCEAEKGGGGDEVKQLSATKRFGRCDMNATINQSMWEF